MSASPPAPRSDLGPTISINWFSLSLTVLRRRLQILRRPLPAADREQKRGEGEGLEDYGEMQQQRSEAEEEGRGMLAAKPSLRWTVQEDSQVHEPSGSVSAAPPWDILAVEGAHGVGEAGQPGEGAADGDDDQEEDDDDDDDFEFAVASGGNFDGTKAVTADEIFSNGVIRPVYPFFNRALVFDGAATTEKVGKPARLPLHEILEGRELPSVLPSETDELEGVPAGSYCAWTPRSAPPSPDLRRKSRSTGADPSKGWRLRNLIVGRSRSDGKDKLTYLSASPPPPPAGATGKRIEKSNKAETPPPAVGGEERGRGQGRGGGKASEIDVVTAHRLYYGRGGAAGRRRSFLPKRREVVGFFGSVIESGGGFLQ